MEEISHKTTYSEDGFEYKEEYLMRCSRCRKEETHTYTGFVGVKNPSEWCALSKIFAERWNLARGLFTGVRNPPVDLECLCADCINEIMPALQRHRDAIELDIAVNKLGRAIQCQKRLQQQDS